MVALENLRFRRNPVFLLVYVSTSEIKLKNISDIGNIGLIHFIHLRIDLLVVQQQDPVISLASQAVR